MTKYPQVIRVVRGGAHTTIEIDGEPFPWAVEGVDTAIDETAAPGVAFTILAERVEVINDINHARAHRRD